MPRYFQGEVVLGSRGTYEMSGALQAAVDKTTGTWLVEEVSVLIKGQTYRQSTIFGRAAGLLADHCNSSLLILLVGTGNAGPLLMSAESVSLYWDQVEESVNLGPNNLPPTFPCRTKLPDFMLQIGNGTTAIPGENLNLGLVTNQTCASITLLLFASELC